MAQIVEEVIIIRVSQLAKNQDIPKLVTAELTTSIEEIVQELVPTAIVEVVVE